MSTTHLLQIYSETRASLCSSVSELVYLWCKSSNRRSSMTFSVHSLNSRKFRQNLNLFLLSTSLRISVSEQSCTPTTCFCIRTELYPHLRTSVSEQSCTPTYVFLYLNRAVPLLTYFCIWTGLYPYLRISVSEQGCTRTKFPLLKTNVRCAARSAPRYLILNTPFLHFKAIRPFNSKKYRYGM
jgi:hypothetical protein